MAHPQLVLKSPARLFINGARAKPQGGAPLKVISPVYFA